MTPPTDAEPVICALRLGFEDRELDVIFAKGHLVSPLSKVRPQRTLERDLRVFARRRCKDV